MSADRLRRVLTGDLVIPGEFFHSLRPGESFEGEIGPRTLLPGASF